MAAVVDQTDNPVLVVDEEFKVVLLNKSARDLFQLPDAKLSGIPIQKLVKDPAWWSL